MAEPGRDGALPCAHLQATGAGRKPETLDSPDRQGVQTLLEQFQSPLLVRGGMREGGAARARCRRAAHFGGMWRSRHLGWVTELLTVRLELRRWREDDLDVYAGIVEKPEVGRYVGGRGLDRVAAWRQMALFVGHRELRGFTQSAVVERATGLPVGRGARCKRGGCRGLEVGWGPDPGAWGRGSAADPG